MKKNELILSVRDLNIKFNLRGKILHAIRGIDLDVYHGEVLAIVGESGSGKSVFTKSFMGLLDANGSITSGTIDYYGADDGKPIRLSDLKKEKDWLKVRGHEIAMIMQDPMTSLNPLKTIGDQIMEAVELHQHLKGKAAREKTLEYLRDVGIADPEVRFAQYPHEFSGGMRQRVVIAIAVACNPQILICDEPTTALDVTIQAQILQLIRDLQKELGMSVIYITHDLGVVANVADRVAVMYAGQIVEYGTVEEIFYDAWHPYTWALLQALPQLGTKGEALPSVDAGARSRQGRDGRDEYDVAAGCAGGDVRTLGLVVLRRKGAQGQICARRCYAAALFFARKCSGRRFFAGEPALRDYVPSVGRTGLPQGLLGI